MAAPALVLGGAQAAGTSQWQVPDVVGTQIEAARTALEPFRLTVQEVRVYSQAPKDEVVATLPVAGEVLPERGRLVLRVSAGLPPGAVDVGALVSRLDERLTSLDGHVASIDQRTGTIDERTATIQRGVADLLKATKPPAGAGRGGGASSSSAT